MIEDAVEAMAADGTYSVVGIREIQRTIRDSIKWLVEAKIRALGVEHLFDAQQTVIYSIRNGERSGGRMIFNGMRDHNADSVKSLESFNRAIVDEANRLSARSIKLLYPTIRAPGSELHFAWNPDSEEDPVDKFFADGEGDPDFVCVNVNITDNPFRTPDSVKDYLRDKRRAQSDPGEMAYFEHVWHGAYNTISDRLVFAGKWTEAEFEPDGTFDGPYYGCDFGFSVDPLVFSEWWIKDNDLFCRRDCSRVGVELDEISGWAMSEMPGIEAHVIRADSAEPATISYLQRNGLPRMIGVPKWQGSVEAGIRWLRKHQRIVLHPEATTLIREAKLYRYKENRAGDILPELVDADNHGWDSGRYAFQPLIKEGAELRVTVV